LPIVAIWYDLMARHHAASKHNNHFCHARSNMDNTLESFTDAPLVNVTYARTMSRVANIKKSPATAARMPQSETVETLTFEVAVTVSVEVHVATDARGTVQRVVQHKNAGPQTRGPVVLHPFGVPDKAFAAGLTFTVVLAPTDKLVHVSVTDLDDQRVMDQFMKLDDWRLGVEPV
jgi:hypothetical protein